MSDVTDLLADLVAIDSVNPDLVPGGAGEAEIARFVAGWLERAGLDVTVTEVMPGRPNVVGVARGLGGGRSLLLNAHMDTVGYDGMDDPLRPRVEGARMYGRGAYDMKAGLAAIMVAGAQAASAGLRGDVIVTGVCDEEFASKGANSLAGERRADAAIVTEPTGERLRLALAHKGFTWHEIEVHGRAAHGSRPDEGVDAIARMGRILSGLEQLQEALAASDPHPLLGPGSVHASLIEGGRELSTYPDRCLLQLERRTLPGESVEVVEAELSAILNEAAGDFPDFSTELRTTLVRPPMETDAGQPIVGTVRDVLGRDVDLIGVPFWADSAVFSSAGIPTVIFGAGGEGAHAAVEWVDLAEVELCTSAVAEVCRRWSA
jgi:acetylornithine deacetylase